MREEAEKDREVKRLQAEASRHADVMGMREREVKATELREAWEKPQAEAETAKAIADEFAINTRLWQDEIRFFCVLGMTFEDAKKEAGPKPVRRS